MKIYAELTRKKCNKCKEEFSIQEFQKNKNNCDGYSYNCKSCIKKRRAHSKEYDRRYWKSWREKNSHRLKERDRAHNLKRKFNMSINDYNILLKSQNGVCATCFKEKSSNGKALAVDHCHKTGKIRGLLCNECNTSLGLLKENKHTLYNLIDYLNRKK